MTPPTLTVDQWKVTPATDAARATFWQRESPTEAWQDATVPHRWTDDANPPSRLLYRRQLASLPDVDRPGRRTWLVVNGGIRHGTLWLNDRPVGTTNRDDVHVQFDVTRQVLDQTDHLLAVEAALDPSGLGMWNPPHLEHSGPVRITRWRALCTEAGFALATVRITATLDSSVAGSVAVETRLGDTDYRFTTQVHPGENPVTWDVQVVRPALWWPHQLGDQTTHELTVRVHLVGDGTDDDPSDVVRRQIGLRRISQHQWITLVNGERLYLKGIRLTTAHPGALTGSTDQITDRLRTDLRTIRDADLNLIHVPDVLGHPVLYDLADEFGLCVWQDLPSDSMRRHQAAPHAAAVLDRLGHHPSILMWTSRIRAANVGRSDPTRPVHHQLDPMPHVQPFRRPDLRSPVGWTRPDLAELDQAISAVPRLAQVMTFGVPSLPADPTAAGLPADAAPGSARLRDAIRHHGVDPSLLELHSPADGHDTFAQWAEATQLHQGEVIKHHIETLRRLQYRPAAGFVIDRFADPEPTVSGSVFDHQRSAKTSYAAVADACRQVIVVMQRPPEHLHAKHQIDWTIHVVSDLRKPLHDVTVTAILRHGVHEKRVAWTGTAVANGCTYVGTINLSGPTRDGDLTIDLVLSHPEVQATNRYVTPVYVTDHTH